MIYIIILLTVIFYLQINSLFVANPIEYKDEKLNPNFNEG